jgi:phosphoglycolate phosphatase
MKYIHHILFDFDYTLADSSEGIIASVNHALMKVGKPLADPAVVRKMIGHSLEDMFAQFVDPSDPQLIATCKQLFMEYADTGAMVKKTVILQGVRATLEQLFDNMYTMGIVSTKRRSTIEDTLEANEMDDLFDIVIGYEDVKDLKPQPEGLLKAVEGLAGTVWDTVYVGDSLIDLEAGRNAGIPVIAIASGATPFDELQARQPAMVLRQFTDLLTVFRLN